MDSIMFPWVIMWMCVVQWCSMGKGSRAIIGSWPKANSGFGCRPTTTSHTTSGTRGLSSSSAHTLWSGEAFSTLTQISSVPGCDWCVFGLAIAMLRLGLSSAESWASRSHLLRSLQTRCVCVWWNVKKWFFFFFFLSYTSVYLYFSLHLLLSRRTRARSLSWTPPAWRRH